jgi:hypothetical protein
MRASGSVGERSPVGLIDEAFVDLDDLAKPDTAGPVASKPTRGENRFRYRPTADLLFHLVE